MQIWRTHIQDYLIAEQGCIDATYYALNVLERDKGNCVFGRAPAMVARLLNNHIERGPLNFTIRTKQRVAWIRGNLIGWERDEVIYELKEIELLNYRPCLSKQPALKTREEIEKRWDIFFWPLVIPHPEGKYAELLKCPPPCRQPKLIGHTCEHCEEVDKDWRSR